MDHIVSYKEGSAVKEMTLFKSTAEKKSDLRRWRSRRKETGDVILFFRDGTIFSTFLSVMNNNKSWRHNYWRHYYWLKKDPKINKETLLAYYMGRFADADICPKNLNTPRLKNFVVLSERVKLGCEEVIGISYFKSRDKLFYPEGPMFVTHN